MYQLTVVKYNIPFKALPMLVCMKHSTQGVSGKCSTWLRLVLYYHLALPRAVLPLGFASCCITTRHSYAAFFIHIRSSALTITYSADKSFIFPTVYLPSIGTNKLGLLSTSLLVGCYPVGSDRWSRSWRRNPYLSSTHTNIKEVTNLKTVRVFSFNQYRTSSPHCMSACAWKHCGL